MGTPFDPDDIDLLLRITPPPPPLPQQLQAQSRKAAIPRRSASPHVRRAAAAAMLAAATAVVAALLLSGGTPRASAAAFHLHGPGGARALVTLTASHDQTAAVTLRVTGLRRAPRGRYYQLWFGAHGHRMPALAFLPDAAGDATLHTSVPATITWTQCWISLRGHADRIVLTMRTTPA